MKKIALALLSIAFIVSVSACQTGAGSVEGESVKSEALSKVDYDAASKDLVLVFERGTYKFEGVPQKVYDGLMASKSKGSYFQNKIKGKYEASKIK